MKENERRAANIVLTGFMGTGKSAVGKLVAHHLKRPFVDMDELIEKREGRTITAIFAQEGEAYFRALESRLVQELATRSGYVIATGGGTLLSEENRKHMMATGLVICLWADEDTLIQRLRGDTSRPLLARPDWQDTLRELLRRRTPLYQQLPFHVHTGGKNVEQVAEDVLRIWRTWVSAAQQPKEGLAH